MANLRGNNAIFDETTCKALQAGKQSLVHLIELFSNKLEEVEDLLQAQCGSEPHGEIVVSHMDPFKTLHIWPLTSSTTMGLCREALGRFGRETTAVEIVNLIRQGSSHIPGKSITEMLYKRGSKERSGIYRAHRKPGPAKYGLVAWKEAGTADLTSDGAYQAPEEEMDV